MQTPYLFNIYAFDKKRLTTDNRRHEDNRTCLPYPSDQGFRTTRQQ